MSPIIILAIILMVIIFAITLIKISFSKKKMITELKSQKIPKKLSDKIEKKFSNYTVPNLNIIDIVKNLGIYKTSSITSISSQNYEEKIQYMYPILSWKNLFNFKDSLIKYYQLFYFQGPNILNLNNLFSYTYIKIPKGKLETFFKDKVMTVKFNEQTFCFIDYNNNTIYNKNKEKIGRFIREDLNKILSVGPIKKGLKIPVYLQNKLIGELNPIPSTLQDIKILKESVINKSHYDTYFIKNSNFKTEAEAYILLSMGLFEKGFFESPMGRKIVF